MVFARERSNVTQKCGNLLGDLKERGSVSERGEPSKDVISGAKRKAVLSVVQPGQCKRQLNSLVMNSEVHLIQKEVDIWNVLSSKALTEIIKIIYGYCQIWASRISLDQHKPE